MKRNEVLWIPRLVRALGALALCLIALPVGATQPPSSRDLSEEVKVTLRLVDVLATDRSGEPLIGLGPEDFTVLIDGKEREIRTFDAAVRATPTMTAIEGSTAELKVAAPPVDGGTPEAAVSLGVAPGRWVVILLDADRMPHNYRKVVLKTARAIVTDSGGPEDRFAIALLRNGVLTFLQEFAPAADVDLSVLDEPGRLISRANDLRFRLDELVSLVTGCRDVPYTEGCVMTRSEEFLGELSRENASGFAALNSLIASMYPLPGRKALVWFSNGFVLRPGEVVREVVTRYVGDLPTLYSRLDRRERPYTEELLAAASRAQVSFFALRAGNDVSHAMRGADTATLDQPIDRQAGNPYKRATQMTEEVLREVADATGGKAVMTPLAPSLADGLLNRMDGVYTLGIDVQPGDSPNSRLKIKLNRKKSDLQVRKRLPHRAPPAPVLSAVLQETPTGLQGTVGATLSVDLALVKTEQDRDSGVTTSRLACFALLRRPDGSVVDQSYRIYEVLRGDATQHRFEQLITFDHPPGAYQVEVTLSDLIGNGSTSVVTVLTGVSQAAN